MRHDRVAHTRGWLVTRDIARSIYIYIYTFIFIYISSYVYMYISLKDAFG